MLFQKKKKSILLTAPLSGRIVPITQVPDHVFAERILGDGVAIIPSGGVTEVYAPADATVDVMFDTGHAVSMTTAQGVEVLIHVGIDTVQLKGAHFTVYCKTGEQVKAGQRLLSFDADAIAAAGHPIVTPVVLTNLDAFQGLGIEAAGAVNAGDLLFKLKQ